MKDKSKYKFTFGVDHKISSMKQASLLNFYDTLYVCDGDKKWPFRDGTIKTFFSNIFYWINTPDHCFKELHRILSYDGTAYLCLELKEFIDYTYSYRWKNTKQHRRILKLINRGRDSTGKWVITGKELGRMAKKHNLEIIYKKKYLSSFVLKIWDVGTRCISDIFIDIFNNLPERERKKYKLELISRFYEMLQPVYEEERDKVKGGFIFVELKKRKK